MKEVSIEEKAKAYDIAIERAAKFKKEYLNYKELNVHKGVIEAFDSIFHETKESKDERTRNFISNELACLRATEGKGSDRYEELTNAIAWIEKQGEQKLADNVIKTKFHKGDWIIHQGTENIYQVVAVLSNSNHYHLRYGDNYTLQNCADVDRHARLWDITKDAKDGDLLVDEDNNIGIHKEIEGLYWDSYIYLGCDGKLRGFSIGGNHKQANTRPATKEQRDLFFQKMKEAGYEWDAEKKELKKIEQNLADKVEPKFHEGEWVVNKFGDSWHIDSFNKKNYQVSDGKGNYNWFPISKHDEMHKWTIQDAKDGDVLVKNMYPTGPSIFIFKEFIRQIFTMKVYCSINNEGQFLHNHEEYYHRYDVSLYPATKEQRDLFFQKMKEAGYEWDAENKELRSIGQNNTEDEYYK